MASYEGDWQLWFAWHPVHIMNDRLRVRRVWLRYVKRRRVVQYEYLWGSSRWWQYANYVPG